jgi:hypothetical protein
MHALVLKKAVACYIAGVPAGKKCVHACTPVAGGGDCLRAQADAVLSVVLYIMPESAIVSAMPYTLVGLCSCGSLWCAMLHLHAGTGTTKAWCVLSLGGCSTWQLWGSPLLSQVCLGMSVIVP